MVLGGVSRSVHEHVYTGDENDDVLTRLRQGRPVTFAPHVYDQFFTFRHAFKTYRWHVLAAGVWLVTGVYNLRNPPTYAGRDAATGRAVFEGWWHRRGSGGVYLVTSVLKALTATMLSLKSHTLGVARVPMAACGLYDAFSVVRAVKFAVDGNPVQHKRWMIRNFGVGAGSIWVRVFAAAWAACDLSFMGDADLYGEMNEVALVVGFLHGILFSEWWLAEDALVRRKWAAAQLANVAALGLGARVVYARLAARKNKVWSHEDPELAQLGNKFRELA